MLFALALGAITVGMGFHSQIPSMANINNAYDMGLVNASTAEKAQIAAMKPKTTATYHFKATKKVPVNSSKLSSVSFQLQLVTGQWLT
ncbi:hypothetical protein WP50_26220 [Lactiplantibacillus plantarum]|nr:hypothetical protein WP50_26220 [Lactiplantibacillus plantarum]